MSRPLTSLELDFLRDLCREDHQIWQVFEFFKFHNKSISDEIAFHLALKFLADCIRQGWIDVLETRGKREKMTPEMLKKFFAEFGLSLLTQFDSTVFIEITAKGEEICDASKPPQNL